MFGGNYAAKLVKKWIYVMITTLQLTYIDRVSYYPK